MKQMTLLMLWIPVLLLLNGCNTTFSGLSGATAFSCKAPSGVSCQSLSGVYENSIQNNLPWQNAPKHDTKEMSNSTGKKEALAKPISTGSAAIVSPPDADAVPLRTETRVLRIWMAPWMDADGDMHDQSYTYTVVDDGRWMIEKARDAIRAQYTVPAPQNNAMATGFNAK